MDRAGCAFQAQSNEYADFIVNYSISERVLSEVYNINCVNNIDNLYLIAYANREELEYDRTRASITIPRVYALLDSSAVISTNVLRVRNTPFLELYGNNVMIGFVDTGIDYTNPLFINADGSSRIYGIWDQTAEWTGSGDVPYGRSYSRDDITRALMTDNPQEIVPQRDSLNGHGTFMAGIASGNISEEDDFTGMAPLSYIGVVKLKEAKSYLKNFYGIDENVECYQENDIMLGVNYLTNLADQIGCPLVLCIGVGTNLGDHNGSGFLDSYLNNIASQVGIGVVAAAGNETNKAHHFRGQLGLNEAYQDVEIRVAENTTGFTLQLWTKAPDVVAVGFISPTGETYDRIPAKIRESRQIQFTLENSRIEVDYSILQQNVGDELIEMRFYEPAPGIWTIRVFNDSVISGIYDVWLPVTGIINEETYFLKPDPDITITEPANSEYVISVAGYDNVTQGIYINSGRGFTRNGEAKPDITAPAVNVYSTLPLDRFGVKTGTSVAAAITAGAAALVQEWAFDRENDIRMNGNVLRKYIIRGANRSSARQYPNKEWGYGTLDVYGIFESLS